MIKDSLLDVLFAVISNDAIRAASRNALKRPRSNRSMKLVRCFKGGYNAQQETPIIIALEEFTAKGLIIVETLHCERVSIIISIVGEFVVDRVTIRIIVCF